MRVAVWAPHAATVELVLAEGRRPMEAAESGWFASELPSAGPGTRYGFALDGGPMRPDPRSARQPDGVHGLSEVIDPAAFAWTDRAWSGFDLRSAVLYELHVGTFSAPGTFAGVIDKLDYLVDLGVTAIELMPVAAFPGRHGWGYDGVDLFAVHEPYGGPDGLKRLVDAAHSRRLGVVLDVVYNHLGPAGNYLAEFGPYFTDRYTTPWGPAVNFDGPGSDEVRRFVLDNAAMWVRDYHIDALRLDAVHAIFDSSPVHILEALATETAGEAWLIAESEVDDSRLVTPRAEGGYGLDAAWNDDFHHALHVALTGEREGYYADFRPDDVEIALRRDRPERFVAFTQNHDQVGNRAGGERLVQIAGFEGAAHAAETLLRAPFIPLLFMGEEWGASTPFLYFTDHEDAALGRAVSEGRRREFAAFGWAPEDVPDPQDRSSYEASKLRWAELEEPANAALLARYRELMRHRRQGGQPAQARGSGRRGARGGAATRSTPRAAWR